jgi:hypothetical protein
LELQQSKRRQEQVEVQPVQLQHVVLEDIPSQLQLIQEERLALKNQQAPKTCVWSLAPQQSPKAQ